MSFEFEVGMNIVYLPAMLHDVVACSNLAICSNAGHAVLEIWVIRLLQQFGHLDPRQKGSAENGHGDTSKTISRVDVNYFF